MWRASTEAGSLGEAWAEAKCKYVCARHAPLTSLPHVAHLLLCRFQYDPPTIASGNVSTLVDGQHPTPGCAHCVTHSLPLPGSCTSPRLHVAFHRSCSLMRVVRFGRCAVLSCTQVVVAQPISGSACQTLSFKVPPAGCSDLEGEQQIEQQASTQHERKHW